MPVELRGALGSHTLFPVGRGSIVGSISMPHDDLHPDPAVNDRRLGHHRPNHVPEQAESLTF